MNGCRKIGSTLNHAELTDALRVAQEHQAATSAVVRLLATSPANAKPVLEAIVAAIARLCDAEFTAVSLLEGGLLHLNALSAMPAEATAAYRSIFPRTAGRHFVIGRAFVDGRPVHVEDIGTDPDFDPRTLGVLQRAAPARTYLGIPIVRDGAPIGAIGCGRREVKPFTPAEIALVTTFADLVVVALRTARRTAD